MQSYDRCYSYGNVTCRDSHMSYMRNPHCYDANSYCDADCYDDDN